VLDINDPQSACWDMDLQTGILERKSLAIEDIPGRYCLEVLQNYDGVAVRTEPGC
jgi:hypothetical protein